MYFFDKQFGGCLLSDNHFWYYYEYEKLFSNVLILNQSYLVYTL